MSLSSSDPETKYHQKQQTLAEGHLEDLLCCPFPYSLKFKFQIPFKTSFVASLFAHIISLALFFLFHSK
jgi:hypothetical protein